MTKLVSAMPDRVAAGSKIRKMPMDLERRARQTCPKHWDEKVVIVAGLFVASGHTDMHFFGMPGLLNVC